MHYQRYQFGPGRLTEGIKMLIIINAAVFFLGELTGISWNLASFFGIVPVDSWSALHIWQPFTYLFLHGNLMHIAMNMLILWMFGSELEMIWGRRYFLKYYFVTGVGAGLLTILFQPFSNIPVIGASGAIYGVLLAYGLRFPDREVLIYFLFPVKVKYMVTIIGFIAFMSSLSPQGDNIAHFTHLSGMLIGYLMLRYQGPSNYGNYRNNLNTINDSLRKIRETLKKYYEQNPAADPRKRGTDKNFNNQNNNPGTDLRRELDALLEKVNRVGYGGLEDHEKERLFKASNDLSRHAPKQ